MSKTVMARNTVSGVVGEVPASYLTHAVLGKTLVRVDEKSKNIEPALHKPTDAEGFTDRHSRADSEDAKAEDSGKKK